MKPVIVLDTNILLDIFVFDEEKAHPLRAALENHQIDFVATQHMLNEYQDVISREQFSLTPDQQRESLLEIGQLVRLIDDATVEKAPWKCRDRDDQIFLNLAYFLRPALLISKDKQVLKIAKRAIKEGVTISSDHTAFVKSGD